MFKLDTSGHITILHTFTGGTDGKFPGGNGAGPLVLDAAGNLYGTTSQGGSTCNQGTGCGIVFNIDPTGKETVLHRFSGQSDDGFPTAGLILDAAGNLYGNLHGTTNSGVTSGAARSPNCGGVFKITP